MLLDYLIFPVPWTTRALFFLLKSLATVSTWSNQRLVVEVGGVGGGGGGEVAVWCEKIQQMYENLARSLDLRLLFAGTEAQWESGLSRCRLF